MRKTTKFGEAPWAAGGQEKHMAAQAQGRRTAGMMNRQMRRTGGRRGA